ncbi:MAG: alpha/beta hydrolase fold domain-containing protein [Chitinophagales bacterium]|nr:alpha/beta hydrolase fold domain-containing protein [Chitinophagales bacterium]MDW8419423.1 alpha/beta hydrolase fold domain-containing protein [Chitinophagales bacterium]
MKLYIFTLIIAFAATKVVSSQCTQANRFYDQIYDIDSIEVTYTDVRSVFNKMDVFVPKNDGAPRRPLLMLAHGGGFNSGDKHTDQVVNVLCRTFARRGFVTASIQYRLTPAYFLLDSVHMMHTVLNAIYDAKAAVRYFVKDAVTTHQFRVDSNFIFLGGSSAGAVLSIHYAYLDQLSEVPSVIMDSVLAHGGLEGDAGNPGYSSAIKAAIPMAGGINRTWWIGQNEEPMLLIHGDKDRTVPYYYDQVYRLPPYDNFTLITLYGSGSIDTALTNRGIYHQLKTYYNYDHTPWDTSLTLCAEIDTIVRNFLYPMVCAEFPLSVKETDYTVCEVYPNPASGHCRVNIEGSALHSVELLHITGAKVLSHPLAEPAASCNINLSAVTPGLYLLKIQLQDEQTIVRKIYIE